MSAAKPRKAYRETPPKVDIKSRAKVAELLERGDRFRTAEKSSDGCWYSVTYMHGREIHRKPYRLHSKITVTASTQVYPGGGDYLKRRAEIAEESGRQRRRAA